MARCSRVVSESTVMKISVSATRSNTYEWARRLPWLLCRVQRISVPLDQVPAQ